ncbi:MAG: Cyclohexanone monooxygenase [Mycobacterium sp.]|nr:Cyclohexanone monooxygenase [Mycobacterium sp.]
MTHREYDVVVVGAGFGGIYALIRLRSLGFNVHVVEAAPDVGGVWYWNCYPGARCDIESMEYSYSFSEELQQEWEWSQRYPTQPEMYAYARHVVERFDLEPHISFGAGVTTANYDEAGACWTLGLTTADTVSAQFCVMATGTLSAPRPPQFPGLERYRGSVLQTAEWPRDPIDFSRQRVGVIGTGSSGIQVIPQLAVQAEQLHVFQRTANYSISGVNEYLDPETVRQIKRNYPALRDHARRSFGGSTIPINRVSALDVSEAERARVFEERWKLGGFAFLAAFIDVTLDERANELAAEFVRGKIREAVHDPDTAELLMPRDHPIGSKRICVDTDYYTTFNRPNVHLIDLRANPIESFTETGLTAGGVEYPLDAVVLATGFDALTGALTRIDIRGRGGRLLRHDWADGAESYLGLAVEGYPNLFTVMGPGSPSVLSNGILAIEQHVDWIGDCLHYLRRRGIPFIEATAGAQQAWAQHVREVAERTLYPRADSWYMGSNIAGKPRVFLPYVGGVGRYRKKCAEIAAQDYAGFVVGTPAVTAPDDVSVSTSAAE